MPTLLVRYAAPEEGVPEIVAAVQSAFAAVRAGAPDGVRYLYWRDGTEFVALLELDDGVENPLFGIPAARELQATVAKWVDGEPPVPRPVQTIGAYEPPGR